MSQENLTFEREINNFVNYGTYIYQFDEAGNLILNPSSSVFQQHYISFEMTNFNYDSSKVLNFYSPVFEEFLKPEITSSVTVPQELQEYIDNIAQENEQLRQQLDDAVASVNSATRTASDEQAIKDLILQLRIALGQGKTAEDFYTTFPYLAITPGDRALGETTIEVPPSTPVSIPPTPNVVFSHTTQKTGSGATTVTDTRAIVIVANTGSAATKLSAAAVSPKNIVTVTHVYPSHTNPWTKGLTQYKAYDPNQKKYVWIVKDLASGYYVDRTTGIYYQLPPAYQKFGVFK